MKIDVVGRDIPVTEGLQAHAQDKVGKVAKFFDGVQHATVTLSKQDHHHHGNTHFAAELVLSVVKHGDIVAHAENADLYKAIDEAAQKSERQVRELKERLRDAKH